MHYLAIFMHEDKGEMGERQTETEGKGACERQGKEREEREKGRKREKKRDKDRRVKALTPGDSTALSIS